MRRITAWREGCNVLTEWLETTGSPIQGLLGALAVLLAAYGIGTGLDRRLRLTTVESWLIRMVLGLDVLAFAGLLLGAGGILNRIAIHALVLPCALGGLWVVILRCRQASPGRFRFDLALLPVGLVGIVLFGSSLVTPLNWDEMVYQIAVPVRWLRDGAIPVYPDNPYSGFPSAGALITVFALAMGGFSAPKVLVFCFWSVALAGLYRALRKVDRSGWLAGVITFAFGSSEAVLMSAASTYVELFLLIQFAAILVLLTVDGDVPLPVSSLLLVGVFCGLSAATKLTGWGILPAAATGIWIRTGRQSVRRKDWIVTRLLPVILVSSLTALPFYLRPWLQTGNPCFPYFMGFFLPGTSEGLKEMSLYHHALGSWKFGLSGPVGWLTTPFLLCIPRFSSLFDGGLGFSCLVLAVLFGLILLRYRRQYPFSPNVWLCLSMAGIGYLAWYLTARQARFLLPAVYAFYYGMGIMGCGLPVVWRRWLAAVLLVAALVSLPVGILRHGVLCWRHLLCGGRTIDLVYSATGGEYIPMMEVIETRTPRTARIFLLFEHRTLYVPRPTLIGTPFFQGRVFTPPEGITPERAAGELARLGVTHVLLSISSNDPDRLPEYLDRNRTVVEAITGLAARGMLTEVQRIGDSVLYAVEFGRTVN